MKLVGQFQYAENYGYRWKFKGGEMAELADLTTTIAANLSQDGKMAEFVKNLLALRPDLVWANSDSEQYLLRWELLDDGELKFTDDPDTFGDRADLSYGGLYRRLDGSTTWYFTRKQAA